MISGLSLMRLRFELQVATPLRLPEYKGDLLRRGLLWHLGSIWCQRAERCRERCQSPESCFFGQLIEPPLNPAWSEPIRRLMGTTPPPAYVLWDAGDRRTDVAAGDFFAFEQALIGQKAIAQFPAFIAAWMTASEQGIGMQRLKGRLRRVEVLSGAQGESHPLMIDGRWQGDPDDALTDATREAMTWRDQLSPAGPVTRLGARFLSPMKIEARGETVRKPEFVPLMRAIVRRLRILSQVHGAGEWPQADYGPLLDLADGVELERSQIRWAQGVRHSQRGGDMPMEGFTGEAWYRSGNDLRPLLPALWLGQWVHAGKAAVWGNGRYEVLIDGG